MIGCLSPGPDQGLGLRLQLKYMPLTLQSNLGLFNPWANALDTEPNKLGHAMEFYS